MEEKKFEDLPRFERRKILREKEKASSNSSQSIKKVGKWIVIIAVLGLIGINAYQFFSKPTPPIASNNIEIVDSDRIKGNTEAKVTLVEYGDFQCPSCAAYYFLVKEILSSNSNNIRVIYRHFPLSQIHKNALPSAKAAEAAGKQYKFWEMHDMLYEKQANWSDSGDAKEIFLGYAKELGLDEGRFLSDYDSQEVNDKISADVASANRLGVNSTPTFFLNGKKVSPKSDDDFKKLIKNEISSIQTGN